MTAQFRHTGRGLGLESLEIRQMLSGNPGESPVVLAPAPVAGVLTLAEARITLGNLAEGSTPQVRVNSGPWTALQPDAGGDASLPRLRQGANTAVFRQVAANGTPSAAESITIRFDSIAPPQPLVALRRPGTGGFTSDPTLRIGRVETDTQIQYSVNGAAWSNVYAPADGPTIVRLRAVDDAGNTSRPSAPIRFTLDRVAAAPVVSLRTDTGVPDDRITTDGLLRVTGVEPGAKVEYSTNDGRTWKTSFGGGIGFNEVLVRQRDRARNVSDATVFTFTRTGLLGNYNNNTAIVYNALEPHRQLGAGEATYRSGLDGVKGWIVNKTDRPVLVVDKNNPRSTREPRSWVIQPGKNMIFWRNTPMQETRGLQSAHGVRFEISDYHTPVPQLSTLELRDPFTGKPDTIYDSTWDLSKRVVNVRDDWSEGSVHEEHAGSHSLKIQRLNDGLMGDGKFVDVADWAVFVVEIRRIK